MNLHSFVPHEHHSHQEEIIDVSDHSHEHGTGQEPARNRGIDGLLSILFSHHTHTVQTQEAHSFISQKEKIEKSDFKKIIEPESSDFLSIDNQNTISYSDTYTPPIYERCFFNLHRLRGPPSLT
ncbi:hypothetical protein [Roseivirga pacifica]|uniref:hypothetical protein n=1 Tax=Roseivirga pacifica TaxID=1267423 RepID=UPI003BAA046E